MENKEHVHRVHGCSCILFALAACEVFKGMLFGKWSFSSNNSYWGKAKICFAMLLYLYFVSLSIPLHMHASLRAGLCWDGLWSWVIEDPSFDILVRISWDDFLSCFFSSPFSVMRVSPIKLLERHSICSWSGTRNGRKYPKRLRFKTAKSVYVVETIRTARRLVSKMCLWTGATGYHPNDVQPWKS